MRSQALAILVASLLATATAGADECAVTETVVACATRALRNLPAPSTEEKTTAAAAATTAAKDDLAAQPTTSDTAGENTAGAKEDFNPRLALLALLAGDPSEDTDGNLVFDLNFLIAGTGLGRNTKLQAIVNTEPDVSTVIADRIPEADRDDLVAKLKKSVEDTDDVTFSAAYTLQSKHWGRSFEQYRKVFADLVGGTLDGLGGRRNPFALFAGVLPEFEACLARRTAAAERPPAVQEWLNTHPEAPRLEVLTFADFNTICEPDKATQLRLQVESAIVAARLRQVSAQEALDESGIQHFGQLVDNQPQFFFTARSRRRGELVGANETSVEATYEFSQTNLNAALGEDCDRDAARACLSHYREYVTEHANEGAIDAGNRFSVRLKYLRRDDLDVDLSAESIDPFVLEGGRSLVIDLSWSRRMSVANEKEPMLVELTGSYENVSDDPLRQDRGVAALTVTRKLTNGMSLPIGLVYANHGKYLGEVDEQLSAHIGLKLTTR